MQVLANLFSQTSLTDMVDVLINIGCAAIMSQLVYIIFIHYGNTFSNRKYFGKIFLLVTVCTTLMIVIIKASLALSLGLVGALSIVRFRAAVKEPEELAYTFLSVAIGLGFGAGERGLTIFVGCFILFLLIIRGLYNRKSLKKDTYNFSVITSNMDIDTVMSVFDSHTSTVTLRRCDNDGCQLNAQFNVEFSTVTQLKETVNELKANDPNVMTSFVANSTLI